MKNKKEVKNPEMMKINKDLSLKLPAQIYNDLVRMAVDNNITLVEILWKALKLVLVAENIHKDPNAKLLVEDEHGIKEIETF